jgi:hypothetical protein
MTITYKLRTIDGENVGQFATTLSDWRPGMEFRAAGNRLYRIVSIEDAVELWWVAPVDGTGQVQKSD